MTKYLEWPEELLAEVDLIVGGIPCTAFSVAGARNSLSDPRGQLTLTYVKLINHIDAIRKKYDRQPAIIVYENVPGIYSTRDNAFGCLVGALCGQSEAIETETGKWPTTGIFWGTQRRVGYRTLDAQYFGVAQQRRRCFIVAVANETIEHFGNRYCPSEILSIAKSLRGDTAPSRKTWKAPTAHAENRTHGDSGRGSLLNAYQTTGAGYWREDQIAGTLRAREQDSHEQLLAFNYNAQVDQMNFNPDTTATLSCSQGAAEAVFNKQSTDASAGMKQTNYVALRGRIIRRHTPMEGERLQGFPDLYTQIPYKNKPTADGPRYKAIGNSMATPVMRYLGMRIQQAVDYYEFSDIC